MFLKHISPESFRPFGTVLQFGPEKDDGWEIKLTNPSGGWRIALLEIERKEAGRLEHHPLSMESFEPLQGMGVLFTAPHDNPSDIHPWLLDKPVCLNPGVWHELISLTAKCSVKITENAEVACVYHQLAKPLQVVAARAGVPLA